MGLVEHAAQRVAQLMGGEVLPAAQSRQTVVGQAARPQDFTHGLLVLRVLEDLETVVNDHPQQCLGQFVGELVIHVRVEIPVQGVHHNICHTAAQLERRQAGGQLGVQDGKGRAVQLGVKAPLHAAVAVGEHRRVAGLAAGSGDGQHRAHGHGLLQIGRFQPDVVPDVQAGIGRAVGHGLGRVDDAAAAHGQNEVGLHGQGLLYALSCQGHSGVGLDAAQGFHRQAVVPQSFTDPVQQAGTDGAAAAVDHQNPAAAVFSHILCRLQVGVRAEHHFGGHLIRKAMQRYRSPFMVIPPRSQP